MKKDSNTIGSIAKNDMLQFNSLADDLKAVLVRQYGAQSEPEKNTISLRSIERIHPLTEWETCIFDGQFLISPNFTVQVLYKVNDAIDQNDFNLAVQELFNQNPMLRSNYCDLGKVRVRVTFRSRTPEIAYRNMENMTANALPLALSKLMDVEKQRAFDPVSDNLVRLNVITTGKNETAIIVTQSILTSRCWSVHELIAKVLGHNRISPENLAGVYIPEQEPQLSHAVDSYWKSLLKELPPKPELPGYKPSGRSYVPGRCELRLSPSDMKALLERSNNNKSMLMTTLQAAWGMMLRYISGSPETYYCMLVPDNCARLHNATATASIITPMIVRLKCSDKQTIKEIIGQQFRQMFTSQSYPCTRMMDMLHSVGIRKPDELFSHILSFHALSMDVKSYPKAEASLDGRVVDMRTWESNRYDLVVYFHMIDDRLNIHFVYDKNKFEYNGVERLAKHYETILRHFLEHWESPCEELVLSIDEQLSGIRGKALDPSSQSKLQLEAISKLVMFAGLPMEKLAPLSEAAQTKTFFENQSINLSEPEDSLLFVLEGAVARSMKYGSAMLPLDVMRANECLNSNDLVSESKSEFSLQTASKKTSVLYIPLSAIRADNELLEHAAEYAARDAKKYGGPGK